jgi:predicted flap endonuclease-1-like 5' DNA nuclease
MIYLVLKIVLFLALAALCGGLLAHWWLRRKSVDVTEEYDRLVRTSVAQGAAAERAWRTVEERLSAIGPAIAAIPTPDLEPIESRLALLAPLAERIDQLTSAVGSLRGADLGPLEERIDRLQQQLDALRAFLDRPPAPTPPLAMAHSGNGKNRLQKAAFGPPDDLQRIRGIGPVLNRLLHRVGVFYFWQIAEWTEEDVAFVDGKLDAFKGRIKRERWMEQAARLAHGPDTAKPPLTRLAPPERQPSAFAP